MKIKKGDVVKVIAGKEKGKTGIVTSVLVDQNKVIIENVNMVKKSVKPSQANPEGSIVSKEAPIHISNVAYYDNKSKQTTKIGFAIADGKKIRVAKNPAAKIAK